VNGSAQILGLREEDHKADEELEFQVNDRRSFEEFIGLGDMNSIPDATTVAFFRERLRHAEFLRNCLSDLRSTYVLKAWRPVVDRSSMALWCRSISRETHVLRMKPSRQASCP
jgi:hypothetical protein